MRRRRPMRPMHRRNPRVPPFRPVPPKLRKAHQLFTAGNYIEAANLYLSLADKASNRDIPQTPNLYFRASAAFLKADEVEKAKGSIIKGFNWLLEKKKWVQLKKSSAFTINKLRDNNQQEIADFVQDWITKNVPDDVRSSASWIKTDLPKDESIRLPSNCKNCGGPVNPKEIEWFDSSNAICNYCGCVLVNE